MAASTKVEFDIFARDKASPVFDRFGNRVDASAKGLHVFRSAALGAASGFASLALIDKTVDLFASSIKGASDLNETLNLNSVIFGRDAKAMVEWSKSSATSFGLSQQAALQATGHFGDMFSQLGFAREESFDMSQQVVQLAADLGSLKNLKTEDVLERIGAGFRGEYDSLQLLIPNITAARVQKEALARTGKKNAEALTAEEKAAATLAIIQKDGAAAQGDFAKTSDDLANSSKILTAEWSNAKTELGQGLLPMATDLVHFLSDEGVPAFEQFGDWFTAEGVPAIESFIDTATPIAQDLFPALGHAIGPVVEALELGAGVVGAIGDAFGALPSSAQNALLLAGGIKILAGAMPSLALGSLRAEAGLVGVRTQLGLLAARQAAPKLALAAIGGAALTYADDISEAGSMTNGFIKIAGATAMGAAFGPWGAIIGGASEALQVFGGDNEQAKSDVSALTESLDEQTGALTENTTAMITKSLSTPQGGAKQSAFDIGKDIDIAPALITDAALGNAEAYAQVMGEIQNVIGNHDFGSQQYKDAIALAKALGITTDELARAKEQWAQEADAKSHSIELNKLAASTINKVAKETKGIPKSVISKFTQPGYAEAVDNAIEIARRYNLTPKQVRTVLKQLGFDTKQIDAVIAGMKRIDGTTSTVTLRKEVLTVYSTMRSNVPQSASGTDFWGGGLTTINEEGWELVDLPRGSKIYSHPESKAMLGDTTSPGAVGTAAAPDSSEELLRMFRNGIEIVLHTPQGSMRAKMYGAAS